MPGESCYKPLGLLWSSHAMSCDRQNPFCLLIVHRHCGPHPVPVVAKTEVLGNSSELSTTSVTYWCGVGWGVWHASMQHYHTKWLSGLSSLAWAALEATAGAVL